MPWFAWIAIVGIVVWGVIAIISMTTGRPLPSGAKSDEVEELQKRIAELEAELAIHRRASELLGKGVSPKDGSRRSR